MAERQPMTPSEFDAACRELIHRCPWLSETSGRRTWQRNEKAEGDPQSKHLIGMARDFVWDGDTAMQLARANLVAIELGLWTEPRPHGTGPHLHVQGLPVGPVAGWWLAKYGGFDGKEEV